MIKKCFKFITHTYYNAGLCVGFEVFWVGSLHMGGGALFAAKPGYAQPLGALGLNYSVVLSAWKYHAIFAERGQIVRA